MTYYVMYTDPQGQWRWSFKASNHEIIAMSSEGYWHKSDCEHAIELVKGSRLSPIYVR
jgi:uncharacterized protein